MSKKYMFFDIDGTLTDENPGGKILDSTKRTLTKLRSNGHFVAIATGRAHFYAKDFASENGFENMVSDGGNGITIDGQLIDIEPLDRNVCLEIIEECLEKKIGFWVQLSNEPIAYVSGDIKVDTGMGFEIRYVEDFSTVKQIYKISIFATKEQEKELKTISKIGYMRYMSDHLIVEPLEKYRGIEKMVKTIGGDINDIVVFGDGKNDISMINKAPISIAMGNAIDEVKQVATFITRSNKDDGIEYACKYFKWID